nr:MAG TPA: hypothetical protein [Caudoviricetes sp.]
MRLKKNLLNSLPLEEGLQMVLILENFNYAKKEKDIT